MAVIQLNHAPILQHTAQLLILPVNNTGIILDPVIARCKSLYPDNYQIYRRACLDETLAVGSCLIHKRQREKMGLSVSGNGNQPSHIANLVIADHPYHPTRKGWLKLALTDLQQQLYQLMRYDGLRHVALLARPLIYASYDTNSDTGLTTPPPADLNVPILQWQADIYPLLCQYLQDLPKLRVSIHLPKDIDIQ